ncbi:MAG: hypothetical protein FJ150_10535 [Euryarchaeota archaeon]|nr:hypothetical protein [Euryarchaeota archaeon]
MTIHFRIIEKELTGGNHISSHLYQISSEKKYVIFSKENSKYRKWEEHLNRYFPFDLSNYFLRALTSPSPGGVTEPWLSLVLNEGKQYDNEHLKLLGINNKYNYPIDFGICKSLYDVGKKSLSRCCFTYKSFLKTNHFMIDELNIFINKIDSYNCGIKIPSAVCFSIDENGEIYDDVIHVQYPCENKIILKNLAEENSSIRKFLINEYNVQPDKIDKYNFKEYYKKYRQGQFYYIKIAISKIKSPIVKFYRHSKQ